jgi:small subunit ribosomal protein S1
MNTPTVVVKNSILDQVLKDKKDVLTVKIGDLVRGTVVEKRPKQVFINLGVLGMAVIYGAEYKNAMDVVKKLEVNGEVFGKIVDLENEDGYIELSLREADKQRGWEAAHEAQAKDEAVEVKVSGYNRGGLVANIFGLQAFMPVSHLSSEKYPRVGADQQKILDALRSLVGQTLSVRVITVNQKAGKLIISERAAAEDGLKEIIKKYAIGDVINGIVSGVVDFGVFVRFADSPELEGLVHLSEIDHRLIDNPKSVVSVGETVKAKIIDIKDNRISLSMKALKENPWDMARTRYHEGQEIMGEVSKFNPFGALVRLDEDFQGMIHVSEFGGVDQMHEALEVGKKYPFTIQAVKPEDKRIVLVLKAKEAKTPKAAEE